MMPMASAFIAPLPLLGFTESTRSVRISYVKGLGANNVAPRKRPKRGKHTMMKAAAETERTNQQREGCPGTEQNICTSVFDYLSTRAKSDVKIFAEFVRNLPRAIAAAAVILSLLTTTVAWPPLSVLAAFPDTPPISSFYDEPSLVSKSASKLLTNALSKIKERTGYNVQIALVRSLPYEVGPQEYAEQLYRDWNLGSKDVVIVAGVRIARAGLAAGDEAAKLLTKDVAESICNETYPFHAGEESYSSAVLDISNRLIPILNGEKDPGPPDLSTREAISTFKTKQETEEQKGKYSTVVIVLLIAAFVAPMVQYYWYVRDK